jgi:hypothetical protein
MVTKRAHKLVRISDTEYSVCEGYRGGASLDAWIFRNGANWYWKAIGYTGANQDGSYGPFGTRKAALASYEVS